MSQATCIMRRTLTHAKPYPLLQLKFLTVFFPRVSSEKGLEVASRELRGVSEE